MDRGPARRGRPRRADPGLRPGAPGRSPREGAPDDRYLQPPGRGRDPGARIPPEALPDPRSYLVGAPASRAAHRGSTGRIAPSQGQAPVSASVSLAVESGVARVRISNPGKRNAFTWAMYEQLES